MNPFLEDDDVAIPLKQRNYSNCIMDEHKDNIYNNHNDDPIYGTFKLDIEKVNKESHTIQQQTTNTNNNDASTATTPLSHSQPLRTDKVTGSRYRRLRSIPMHENKPNEFNLKYEKEVFNSMNMYSVKPRNESIHNIMSMSSNNQKKRKKDVSDDTLTGYEWLGTHNTIKSQMVRAASNVWHHQAIALLLLALLVTVVAFIISQMTNFCWGVINYVYTNNGYSQIFIFFACLLLKCGFVFAAIFFTITTPQTSGSGIPELKAILSGIWIRKYLSLRGFFVKSLALVCALGSGLPIGIEGPVIHISAIIGRQLTRISIFQHIDRKMLLSAACACGIAVIFGAPIGGVLFSIEVTNHYYKVDSYWSAFLCATFAALFTAIVQSIAPTTLQLMHTSFEQQPYQPIEFIIFTTLGVISGFLGAAYVSLHRFFTLFRTKKLQKIHGGFWNNSYVIAAIVTCLYVFCAFILGEFAFQPSRMAISDLFNAKKLADCNENECNFYDWAKGFGVYWNLFMFSTLNYFFSICFLCLDWPCGCFASVFAIGAATGRLLGEVLNFGIMHWYRSETQILAATYAVVGAASLVGGVTRTFSVAVIVIEMTSSVELSVPVLLAVVISWTIASWLSPSLYDSILNLRGIPLLPVTPKYVTNFDTFPIRPFIAEDLMVSIQKYGYLDSKSSLKEVALMLQHSNEIFFPVLSVSSHTLLGEVSRQILEEELSKFGYCKNTTKRSKLLSAAKREIIKYKRLQTLSQNLKICQNAQQERDEEEEAISIKDENHFTNLLQSPSSNEEQNNMNRTRRWDEKRYLKIEKEKREWIHFDDDKWKQHMNISPLTVIPTMPIPQIYTLFHVLRPDKIYVAKRNELVGVIDEQILLERERVQTGAIADA